MIRRSRLFTVAGAGFTVLLAMLGVVVFAGQAFPFALGNVGSFAVGGTSIDTGAPATPGSFTLVPDIDQNSGTGGGKLPAGKIYMKDAYIQNMVLEKAFDLPGGLGTWKLRISAAKQTVLTDLTLDAAQICAASIDFQTLGIDARGGDPLQSIELRSSRLTLTHAGIETTNLNASGLSLDHPQLSIQRGGYDPVTFACFR